MEDHLWVLPWIALITGVASIAAAIPQALSRPSPDATSEPTRARDWLWPAVAWLALVAAGVAFELKLGAVQSVDYIGARGLLLGSLGGAVLVLLSSRYTKPASIIPVGIALTTLSAARLWLTHGEITGLSAVAVGVIVAVLFLSARSRPGFAGVCVPGAVLSSLLALSMEMGFTRAEQITSVYWPDIPLMLMSAVALGLLASSPLDRLADRLSAGGSRITSVISCIVTPVLMLVASWWLGRNLLHDTTLIKLAGLGACGGALLLLADKLSETDDRSNALLLAVVVFSGITVAYAYWAGYGIAVTLLGIWSVVAKVVSTSERRVAISVGAVAVGILMLAHRAVSLGSGHDDTSITDIWNLVALCAGAILPIAATPNSFPERAMSSPIGDAPDKDSEKSSSSFNHTNHSSDSPVISILSIVTLVAPAALFAYLFATQSIDGLLIGAALSLAVLTGLRRLDGAVVLNALLLGLLLLQSMPVIATWKEPTRHVRVDTLIVLAIAAAVLAVIPRGRGGSRPSTGASDARA